MDRGTVLAANDANGSFATAAEKASMFNDAIKAAYAALVFNEAGLTAANSALIFNEAGLTAGNSAAIFNEAGLTAGNSAAIFNEAGFTTANKALVFREAGLSIANINAIIIHANISDDNAQQILSEIMKANRDLTSGANVYEILDDWDDNKLTGRDGAGTTSTGFTNLFAQKDKFRPEWTQTGVAFSASAGVMHQATFSDAANRLLANSTFVTGTWEIKFTSTNGTGYPAFMIFGSDWENGYMLVMYNSSTIFRLSHCNGTDYITGTWSNDASPHVMKATRDASGNFEIFEDGVSKGTVNAETTVTTSTVMGFRAYSGGTGQTADWDDLKVY